MTVGIRRSVAALLLRRVLCGILLVPGAALGAASASFRIDGSTFDASGAVTASANYQVVGCVGSEAGGVAGSASHRIESGCATAVVAAGPGGIAPNAQPIPTLTGGMQATLVVLLALAAFATLRRRG